MKKLVSFLSLALLLICASCGDNLGNKSEDKAFADSLATAFAKFQGAQLRMQKPQMKMQFKEEYDSVEFMRGFKAAAKLDTSNVSYMLGYSIGINLAYQAHTWAKNGIKVNVQEVADMAMDAYLDDSLNIQELYDEYQLLNTKLQKKIEEAEAARAKAEADKNIAEGEAYVAKLKAEDKEIVTSESGLSYKILAEGEGEKVGEGCDVQVKYVGKHINGESFDDSKGEAVKFNVDRVVPGFSEGLKLLGKGGKAILYVPGVLGYGEGGQPYAGIAPNEMLVFEVEVVDFSLPEPAAE